MPQITRGHDQAGMTRRGLLGDARDSVADFLRRLAGEGEKFRSPTDAAQDNGDVIDVEAMPVAKGQTFPRDATGSHDQPPPWQPTADPPIAPSDATNGSSEFDDALGPSHSSSTSASWSPLGNFVDVYV